MGWTPPQRQRLAIEKAKLEEYFRLGITWIDPQHETKVEVVLKSNSDNVYVLRIYIPADFPSSCPILVVVKPKTLQLRNGTRLPEASYTFHTLADNDGFHRICHFYPPDWTQDTTLYQVFMKGRLWLEAYEGHLSTGKEMDAFLKEQKQIPQQQHNAQNMQRQSLTTVRPAIEQVNHTPLPAIAPGRNTPSTQRSQNPPNSNISSLPTTRRANDPPDNPPTQRRATYSNSESNTRRRYDLNSTRSTSLGRLTSPPFNARYVNEPVTNGANYQQGNNRNLAPSNTHARSIISQNRHEDEPVDMYDDTNYYSDNEESQYFDNVSSHVATTNVPQPHHDDLAYDENYNVEASQVSPQTEPEPNERPARRYRPAGGVLLLPPFRGQDTPLRRVPPKPKPKPQR